jgi:hypothetical protein
MARIFFIEAKLKISVEWVLQNSVLLLYNLEKIKLLKISGALFLSFED